jgi:hypothetical protein
MNSSYLLAGKHPYVTLVYNWGIRLDYDFGYGIATTQPTTQHHLKQLLLGWYYYR